MTYQETIDYLYSQLPMFQRDGKVAYKANLNNTVAMDSHMGHPHRKFRSIHVAGTNGKGSVAHMVAAILQEAGFVTGLYTSPHLKDFRERIRVNGQYITEAAVTAFVEDHRDLIEELKPSFFEITVAMAFMYFAGSGVDIAVVETGMGGRLDSTNILNPLVSVITNIGHDHMQYLGETPEEIAEEKAGIIKPDIPVVVGETQTGVREVFIRVASENNSSLSFADNMFSVDYGMLTLDGQQSLNLNKHGLLHYKDMQLDLLGEYQQKNIVTTLGVLEALKKQGLEIGEREIRSGLQSVVVGTGLRGRWEIIANNPLTVCDTAHNEEGLLLVMEQIRQTPHKKLHIVFGMVADKQAESLLQLLPVTAEYYFTRADIPRAMEAEVLARAADAYELKGNVYDSPAYALEAARGNADPHDLIFIGGSTYIVAELLP